MKPRLAPRLLQLGLFFALTIVGPQASADSDSPVMERISTLRSRCEDCLTSYKSRADRSRFVANLMLLLGAGLAATGSALAGFLTKTKLRKVAAVTGAIGGLVAVIPKLFPDPGEEMSKYTRAARHRDIAVKITDVIPTLSSVPDDQVKKLERYTIQRFADCAATVPTEDVPGKDEMERAGFALHFLQLQSDADKAGLARGLIDSASEQSDRASPHRRYGKESRQVGKIACNPSADPLCGTGL